MAVGVQPGHGHEERAGADRPRVVGDAADRDRRQAGRPDRPAVASGAAQAALGGQARDQPAELDRSGRARRPRGARRSSARSSADQPCGAGRPGARAGSRAGRRRVRGRRSARATRPPNDCLCWYSPYSGSPSCGSLRGAGDVHAAEVHLAAPLADRELDRPPAQEVERARDGRPGAPRGRPSGPSRGGRRGGTGSGRRSGSLGRVRAPRGRRGGRPASAARHQATNGSRGPNVNWRRSPVSRSRS